MTSAPGDLRFDVSRAVGTALGLGAIFGAVAGILLIVFYFPAAFAFGVVLGGIAGGFVGLLGAAGAATSYGILRALRIRTIPVYCGLMGIGAAVIPTALTFLWSIDFLWGSDDAARAQSIALLVVVPALCIAAASGYTCFALTRLARRPIGADDFRGGYPLGPTAENSET